MGTQRQVDKREGEDGETTITISIESPYKDYDEYLERTISGGFYRDTEERKTVDGVEVDFYTYRVEKLSNAPRFIYTRIYRTDEIDYAVQMEVLQTEDKKLKRTIQNSFQSFELIERSGESLGDKSDWVSILDMNKGTPKERRNKRMKSEAAERERASASVPDSWTVKEVGPFLLLSDTDPKFTKKIGDHALAVTKWMEKTFPYVGQGEYARSPIIRILANDEEWGAFAAGSGDQRSGFNLIAGSLEVYTAKTSSGYTGFAIDQLNGSIFRRWFSEKDSDMYGAMATWLQFGLQTVIQSARADGKKVKFQNSRDVIQTRTLIAQDKGMTPHEIMRLRRSDVFASGTEGDSIRMQAAAFSRYIASKDARKNKQAKKFLETYLTTVKEVAAELDEKNKARNKEAKEATTEEEEEAQVRERAERRRAQEKELIQLVLERGFGDWTDSDWKSLDKAWKAWL